MNPFSLEDKVIVITGASSGIGRHTAISCSLQGASVILIGRNPERLQETYTCLSEGKRHGSYVLDLTDDACMSDVVQQINTDFGRIDGIVHCAGISGTLPLKLADTAEMERYFSNNAIGAVNLTRELCKVGRFSKDGGSVVFLSSVAALTGDPGKSLYAMSKGALLSGCRALAAEYARRKIRFNCISPGVIITPINENLPHIKDPEKGRHWRRSIFLDLEKQRMWRMHASTSCRMHPVGSQDRISSLTGGIQCNSGFFEYLGVQEMIKGFVRLLKYH